MRYPLGYVAQVHSARSYRFVKDEIVVKLSDMPRNDYEQCRQVQTETCISIPTACSTGLFQAKSNDSFLNDVLWSCSVRLIGMVLSRIAGECSFL